MTAFWVLRNFPWRGGRYHGPGSGIDGDFQLGGFCKRSRFHQKRLGRPVTIGIIRDGSCNLDSGKFEVHLEHINFERTRFVQGFLLDGQSLSVACRGHVPLRQHCVIGRNAKANQ